MLILGIFTVGILVGYRWFPDKLKRPNSVLQLICIAALVFCMGAMLGRRESFFEELGRLGLDSLLLAVIPMACSALLVFAATKWWGKRNKKQADGEEKA